MLIRTGIFVSAMAVSYHLIAEDAATQETPVAKEMKLTYCEQPGKTAGFEGDDLQSFIVECEERKELESRGKAE